MKKQVRLTAGILAMALAPALVFAHAGHGHDNPLSPGHFISNPEHAIPGLITLSAVAVGTWFLYRKSQKAKSK